MRVSASFPKKTSRLVGRLGSGLRVVGRLGSGVRIIAIFLIFALTAGVNVVGGEGNCPIEELSGRICQRGKCPGGKCPTLGMIGSPTVVRYCTSQLQIIMTLTDHCCRRRRLDVNHITELSQASVQRCKHPENFDPQKVRQEFEDSKPMTIQKYILRCNALHASVVVYATGRQYLRSVRPSVRLHDCHTRGRSQNG